MEYRRPGRQSGRKFLFVILLILLALVSAAVTFIAMGGPGALPFFKKAPAAYFASEPLRALRLRPPADTDEAAMRQYFAGAVNYAEENGFNTLIFEAKSGLGVWWRDNIYPPAPGIGAQDTWRHKTDALAILCAELSGRPIQLWLEMDPLSGGPLAEDAKGKVADYLAGGAQNASSFTPANGAYLDLFCESVGKLPRKYPISGILLSPTGAAQEDTDAFAAGFSALMENLHTALANNGSMLPLGLAYTDGEGPVTTGYARALKDEGLLTYAVPAVPQAGRAAERMAAYRQLGGGVVIQPPGDDNGLLLFYAMQNDAVAGVLYGSYPEAASMTDYFTFLDASLAPVDSPLPAGFEIPQLLGVNYPEQNANIYTDEMYIMGSSDPAQPLLLDGVEILARAPKGSFGVAVALEDGDNSFTFTQGEQSLTLQVQRTAPPTAGPASDSTVEARPGQVVRVASTIASVLTDPGDLSSINETLPWGAEFIVEGSVHTAYNGWAYRMESGDYVLARNCQWLSQSESDGLAAFTGIAVSADELGGEWLNFEGTGAPAAYVAYGDNDGSLTLTFYDTTLQLPEGFSSAFVSGASVEQSGGATVLTLQTSGIWGYSLEYRDGKPRLYLKKPPTLSGDPAKPLGGVRVMLDAGHGGNDVGAPGVMGSNGPPNEKDVNLAQAQAIAYRLRQLGAEVTMTRSDDTFYELDERLAMQMEAKPDFFLSVHHNSIDLNADRSEVMGVESYYFHPYGLPPSAKFAQNLVDTVSQESGRAKRKDAEWTYFYVTRTTVCPSVLFEYGFVVNPWEFEDITSADGLYAVAFATAEALMATLA